jgi:lysozyme family protein
VSLSMSLVLEPGYSEHDADDDPDTERGVTERISASA